MSGTHVAVVAGGLSLQREISLRSGRRVADALELHGYRVTRLDVDDQLIKALVEGTFDVVYLTLHGRAGEDGAVQCLLEVLELPYTGPDSAASSLAWDKAVLKGLCRRHGLATPEWVTISAGVLRDLGGARIFSRVVARLGLPVVVKPAQGSAAMGMRCVRDVAELPAAVVAALSYHDVVLIERYVDGVEVGVSIVDGRALPPVEVIAHAGVYDFAARYTHGAADFYAPARLPVSALERCSADAVAAYALAGCRHVARADMIVDAQGVPWLLELDTGPGMTETSLLPLAAEAEGWTFAELCERIIELARPSVPASR